jgi:hypothetical protein
VIIAVDPGKVSGIAVWSSGTFNSFQEQTWYAVDRIWNTLENATKMRTNARDVLIPLTEPITAIVCESYVITASTLRKTRGENWSLESIGALRWMSNRHGVEFVLQTPADAKRFADDRKLKTAGWHNPTPGGHANDAARHLLTYLARTEPELFRTLVLGRQ